MAQVEGRELTKIFIHLDLNIVYRNISGHKSSMSIPVPMLNIMNGGCHANNDVDIQESCSNKFHSPDVHLIFT